MSLDKLSDKIVFNALKYIKHGRLKIINYDGKEYYFGNKHEKLHADLTINKPGLTFKIISAIHFEAFKLWIKGIKFIKKKIKIKNNITFEG